MITRLQGIAYPENPGQLTVVTHGIGWHIFTPERLMVLPGQQIDLFITWRWNTEQGPSLYGFSHLLEQKIFELLITCPGVGPKLALAALSGNEAQPLLASLAGGQASLLSTVSGIGKKRAESIILHVQEKALALMTSQPVTDLRTEHQLTNNLLSNHLPELIQALQGLGYQRTEITRITAWLAQERDITECTFEQLLRKSLAHATTSGK